MTAIHLFMAQNKHGSGTKPYAIGKKPCRIGNNFHSEPTGNIFCALPPRMNHIYLAGKVNPPTFAVHIAK
jgi:hypothetical protein